MSRRRRRRSGSRVAAGAAWVAGCVIAAGVAGAATGHPWHDAIAEARVDAARSRLEVSMRVDASHLEAMIATRDRVAFDLEAATPGGRDEPRLIETVRASMRARFAPVRGAAAGSGPPEDRFDLHWIGAELEGPDCWLHFEWVAPGTPAAADGTPAAGAARPVQVRATLLIDPAMQQVNTVSVPGHGAARFAAGRTDWTDVGLSLEPRTPSPMRVARAGEAGPRVLLVPGPAGPSLAVTTLAGRLRDHARVEVALWPGCDGEAPPPSQAGPGGWADWAAASLRARLRAADSGPVHLVVIGRDAERLAAQLGVEPAGPGALGSVIVIADSLEPDAEPTAGPARVLERYRRDLARSAGGGEADAARGGVLDSAIRPGPGEDATAAILAAILAAISGD